MATWEVRIAREFDRELIRLPEDVQDELVAHATVLEDLGPNLGRPFVDTLRDSVYGNMKELRFATATGVWRVAFAFDRESRGVLLVAGNKIDLWDKDETNFYTRLIATADARFKAYLMRVESAAKKAVAKTSSEAKSKRRRK